MAQVGLRGVSQKDEFCKMVKDAVQSNFIYLKFLTSHIKNLHSFAGVYFLVHLSIFCFKSLGF